MRRGNTSPKAPTHVHAARADILAFTEFTNRYTTGPLAAHVAVSPDSGDLHPSHPRPPPAPGDTGRFDSLSIRGAPDSWSVRASGANVHKKRTPAVLPQSLIGFLLLLGVLGMTAALGHGSSTPPTPGPA
jgi:hypothetical protein